VCKINGLFKFLILHIAAYILGETQTELYSSQHWNSSFLCNYIYCHSFRTYRIQFKYCFVQADYFQRIYFAKYTF